jgi:hypothetical protein
VKSKSKRLSHEEDVTYHIKIATFSSMKWLWKAWSLEGSQAYIKMGYLSTTNLKWQFYRICSKWFNVATLHPACTKVPDLHKSTWPAQKHLACTKVPGLHKSTWPAQKYLACTNSNIPVFFRNRIFSHVKNLRFQTLRQLRLPPIHELLEMKAKS